MGLTPRIVQTTPLCLLVLLLLLTMQGPGLQDRTDGLMCTCRVLFVPPRVADVCVPTDWCEGLSDAVYGSCTNTVNNPNPTKDMGALPTSCYHPAIGATGECRASGWGLQHCAVAATLGIH